MLRQFLSAITLAVSFGSSAFAGVMLLNTPNGTFTTPDSGLTGFTGYVLSLMTDDRALISGIDLTITGSLHQRWSFDAETEEIIKTPTGVSLTNGDSHLTPVVGALFAVWPTEDNTGTGSPLADSFTRDYGLGTTLRGAWGIPGASQTNKAGLAYVVIPNGSEANLRISGQVATQSGTFAINEAICTSECGPSIFPNPQPGLGIELDFGVLPLAQNPAPLPISLASHPFDPDFSIASITLSGPDAAKFELTGTLPTLLHGGDPPQSFGVGWRAPGQTPGVYNAQVLVNFTLLGTMTFDVQATVIPEPTSLVLAGLMLGGLASVIRRK